MYYTILTVCNKTMLTIFSALCYYTTILYLPYTTLYYTYHILLHYTTLTIYYYTYLPYTTTLHYTLGYWLWQRVGAQHRRTALPTPSRAPLHPSLCHTVRPIQCILSFCFIIISHILIKCICVVYISLHTLCILYSLYMFNYIAYKLTFLLILSYPLGLLQSLLTSIYLFSLSSYSLSS